MSFTADLNEILGQVEPEKPVLRVVDPVPAPPPEASPALKEWDRCKPWIESALEGTFYKIDDIEAMLKRPHNPAQFWPGKTCALVTEVQQHGTEKVLFCWAAGSEKGDMAEILALAPGIEAVGRLMGCSYAMSEGRSGWQKIMKPYGYEVASVVLKKAL